MGLINNFKNSPNKSTQSLKASVIGLHLVSGIIVGAVIGFALDKWLETKFWFSSFFLIVGIIAGFKNMWLDTKKLIAEELKNDTHKKTS